MENETQITESPELVQSTQYPTMTDSIHLDIIENPRIINGYYLLDSSEDCKNFMQMNNFRLDQNMKTESNFHLGLANDNDGNVIKGIGYAFCGKDACHQYYRHDFAQLYKIRSEISERYANLNNLEPVKTTKRGGGGNFTKGSSQNAKLLIYFHYYYTSAKPKRK